jgi:hypothetical protein
VSHALCNKCDSWFSNGRLCHMICNREGFNMDDEQNGCKLVGTTISVAKELTKGQPFLLRSEKNNKNLGKIR